jgi:hypothetical protein
MFLDQFGIVYLELGINGICLRKLWWGDCDIVFAGNEEQCDLIVMIYVGDMSV